jgi:hypothetical protein
MLRHILFGVVLTLGYRMALWLVAWPIAAAIVFGKLWSRRLRRALRRTKWRRFIRLLAGGQLD